MYKALSGVILSGGKSKRMGVNKSLLKINGITSIERIALLMSEIFENTILITNEPELYKYLNLETYRDIEQGKGPLGGIHSGLIHCKTQKAFIISCDMSFMTKEMIKFIAEYKSDEKIIVPKADGFVQQLCGIYDKTNLSAIEEILKSEDNEELSTDVRHKRKCKVLTLIEMTNSKIIDIENEFQGYKGNEFFNMNTSEDYDFVVNSFRNS